MKQPTKIPHRHYIEDSYNTESLNKLEYPTHLPQKQNKS